ncbi:hypothetical protein P3T27_005468 [Kitasatospora sp. MAA19]|uniref:hypothetical protein n=1 Tax=unclassified Kitasatospora TaxID=2633591 RepID=UPI0024741712|nr:hypothetical protein [Kitasatospora sp. MAA19]MDH6708722.1 hypothetical protein [Kitasatospora sp. MAA19]
MAWYQGPSRITVTAVEGQYPQRAVVTVRGAAPVEIPGEVGAVHLVDAQSWQLELEHHLQGEWCPNIRAVQGRWQEIRGVSTQVVHSRNRDRAGDRQGRNLELRIERVAPDGDKPSASTAAPTARRTTAAHQTPARSAGPAAPRTTAGPASGATTPGVRTSTSGSESDFLRPAAPGGRVTGTGGASRATTSWSR